MLRYNMLFVNTCKSVLLYINTKCILHHAYACQVLSCNMGDLYMLNFYRTVQIRRLKTVLLIFIITAIYCVTGCGIFGGGVDRIDWEVIYSQTLDSYMRQNMALNDAITFIAIDFNALEYASDADKEGVKAFFEENYYPVINADLKKLKEDGLFVEALYGIPDGLLLQIRSVERDGAVITIEGMKYKSMTGANWYKTEWTRKLGGAWKMGDTVMTAVS